MTYSALHRIYSLQIPQPRNEVLTDRPLKKLDGLAISPLNSNAIDTLKYPTRR